MVDLEECKKILIENDENYSDEDIIKIREFLCKIARIAVVTTKKNDENDRGKEA
ncbi:hypothetical protein [Flavobacterium sp.]|uniref:hypothetical protein n=1 Tax=Flavobacterium sp. TaxID=239 RepID=UPI0037521F57